MVRVFVVDDHPVFRDGLRRCLEAGKARLPYIVGGGTDVFALPSMLLLGERLAAATEHSTFVLGLAVRLLVVRLLAPEGRPASHPVAMAAAEVGGYVCWGILSALPIRLRFRTVLRAASADRPRAVYQDLGLMKRSAA